MCIRDSSQDTPTRIPLPAKSVSVAAGAAHSLFCLEDGRALGCGSNLYGQLGIGSDGGSNWFNGNSTTAERRSFTLVQAAVPGRVCQVAAGSEHSLFGTYSGEAFACGRNQWGSLGVGDEKDRAQPTRVKFHDGALVLQVLAGGDQSGFVLGFGGNRGGSCVIM
eukprot:TRINITY_DN49933_c0_g1_i1.p1 TRINITY_DN49933_c0_g1~~TRINITY_DN49933_c0_g1_i1.p1  ORF type:complete len:164 (+),score=29.67 TRINITY_DN49933_c0_g1_i1:174-665(+)